MTTTTLSTRPPRLNIEAFAQVLAHGGTYAEAVRAAGSRAKHPGVLSRTGVRLMHKPWVRARVEEARKPVEAKMARGWVASVDRNLEVVELGPGAAYPNGGGAFTPIDVNMASTFFGKANGKFTQRLVVEGEVTFRGFNLAHVELDDDASPALPASTGGERIVDVVGKAEAAPTAVPSARRDGEGGKPGA